MGRWNGGKGKRMIKNGKSKGGLEDSASLPCTNEMPTEVMLGERFFKPALYLPTPLLFGSYFGCGRALHASMLGAERADGRQSIIHMKTTFGQDTRVEFGMSSRAWPISRTILSSYRCSDNFIPPNHSEVSVLFDHPITWYSCEILWEAGKWRGSFHCLAFPDRVRNWERRATTTAVLGQSEWPRTRVVPSRGRCARVIAISTGALGHRSWSSSGAYRLTSATTPALCHKARDSIQGSRSSRPRLPAVP